MPLYQPSGFGGWWRDLVAPAAPNLIAASSAMAAINGGRLTRVVIPRSGTLRDLALYQGASSGNIDVGVYSTASTRAKLYSTGSIACPAANQWVIVGDPQLAVTAGDQYDFAVSADNITASFGRPGGLASTQSCQLPAGFISLGATGATPYLAGQLTTVFPLPATIADASIAQSAICHLLIARIA